MDRRKPGTVRAVLIALCLVIAAHEWAQIIGNPTNSHIVDNWFSALLTTGALVFMVAELVLDHLRARRRDCERVTCVYPSDEDTS